MIGTVKKILDLLVFILIPFGGGNGGGGGSGFFLACENFGRMFDHSPPAHFLKLLFLKRRLARARLFHF